ncbi:MAG: sodium:proton antiporter [Oscillospiraceae bacterium]|nr:sodium:proton antiporter [Oscillospiraceae bacterium]
MELIQQFDGLFYGVLSVLAIMLVLCLIRAVIGPRIADRLVAVNMMGTMVMVSIAILAVVKDQGYLVDICLIYALISFLAVVVLTRIYTGVYREAKDYENKKKGEKTNADT